MQFQLYILFAIFTITGGRHVRNVPKSEEAQLEKEHRNAICCEKNMRCCVKPPPPPIEIRAMIARCPNMHTDSEGSITRNINKPVLSVNEHTLKSFQGFDEDEPLVQSRVVNCRRKILLTLKLHHKGVLNNCKNQYVVIDHVYDPITEKSVRLLNPYVIKLKQEPVKKSYLLRFIDFVNSEAREVVYNKHDGNFTGCYTEKTHPTCGLVKYDGKIIPYSEGFCCSCDAKKNAERQPDSINEKNEPIVSYSDPSFLLDRVECPRNFYKDKDEMTFDAKEMAKPSNRGEKRSTEPTQKRTETQAPSTSKRWQYSTFHSSATSSQNPTHNHEYLGKTKRQDFEGVFRSKEPVDKYLKHLDLVAKKKQPNVYIDDVVKQHTPSKLDQYFQRLNEKLNNDEYSQRILRKIRQASPSGVQKRGGQNCADRFTPLGKDPEHYHESAHCLRFSDVWYGIYKLAEPFVEQEIALNIYERSETETCSDKWREITNQTLHLSNRNPRWEDETPTISISFTTKTMDKCKASKLHSRRILIPESVKKSLVKKYPEIQNGPGEYLVVKPDQIAMEGDQCDKVGVGFEAFYKQPKRCALPRSTCLRNQPKHLWMHDSVLQKKKMKGCYFLKYYGNFSADPIFTNETTHEKYLSVEYTGAHISIIDIEMKADFNAIIRRQATAVITEVYVDSTCEKLTTLLIKVINSNLVSAKYMVQLSDFPLEMPESFSKVKSKMTLIPPQNQYIFNLEIRYRLPSELLYCSVEVLNENHELVALRRVRIQKFDRCICTWHCLCACVASSDGLKCNPMSLEHYHAAGFQGSLPIVTYMVHFTMLDDLLSVAFYFSLFLLTVLLVMGLVKAVLGLCCRRVGMWGLALLFDLPKPMSRYYEPSLRNEKVVYNQKGWPIHPVKGEKVRNISCVTEFCTNIVFFFIYPLGCCIFILRRLCCPHYTRSDQEPKRSMSSTKSRRSSKQSRRSSKQSRKSSKQRSRKGSQSATSTEGSQLQSHPNPIDTEGTQPKEKKKFKGFKKRKKKSATQPYSEKSSIKSDYSSTVAAYSFNKGDTLPEASDKKPKKKLFTKGEGFQKLKRMLRRKSKACYDKKGCLKTGQHKKNCLCPEPGSSSPRPDRDKSKRKICMCVPPNPESLKSEGPPSQLFPALYKPSQPMRESRQPKREPRSSRELSQPEDPKSRTNSLKRSKQPHPKSRSNSPKQSNLISPVPSLKRRVSIPDSLHDTTDFYVTTPSPLASPKTNSYTTSPKSTTDKTDTDVSVQSPSPHRKKSRSNSSRSHRSHREGKDKIKKEREWVEQREEPVTVQLANIFIRPKSA